MRSRMMRTWIWSLLKQLTPPVCAARLPPQQPVKSSSTIHPIHKMFPACHLHCGQIMTSGSEQEKPLTGEGTKGKYMFINATIKKGKMSSLEERVKCTVSVHIPPMVGQCIVCSVWRWLVAQNVTSKETFFFSFMWLSSYACGYCASQKTVKDLECEKTSNGDEVSIQCTVHGKNNYCMCVIDASNKKRLEVL